MLLSSAVDRYLDTRTIKLIFVVFWLSPKHWKKSKKSGLFWIKIMCLSGATYLPAECDLVALWKSTLSEMLYKCICVPDQIRIWTIRVWSGPNPYTHMVRPHAYGLTTIFNLERNGIDFIDYRPLLYDYFNSVFKWPLVSSMNLD